MIAEVTSAALMSENKQMSHPASVDSTPTSANQEDHVSMACHGARRLLQMTDNLFSIIGIEALTAAQGIDLREPLQTSPELKPRAGVLRVAVPTLDEDRYMAPDLKSVSDLVASGALNAAISSDILPVLDTQCMNVVDVKQGSSPIILGFPHTGTEVPADIRARLNETGQMLADTDWHIDKLYDGLLPEVTTVRATFHRYVIDANRDPSGVSLYPGQNTTGLIPIPISTASRSGAVARSRRQRTSNTG